MYFSKKPIVDSCILHLVYINIIPDAQVLYLPYTSFDSDQIPKLLFLRVIPVIYVSQYLGVQALGGAMGGMVIAWGT